MKCGAVCWFFLMRSKTVIQRCLHCSWHHHLRLHVQNSHPRVWSCKSNNGESHTRSGFTAKKVRTRTWLWPSYLELLSSQPSVFTLYPWGRCIRIMDIRRGEGHFLSRILKLPGCEHVNGVLFDFPDVIERAKKFLAKVGIPDNRITFTMGNILKDVPQSTKVDTIIIKNLFVIFTDDEIIKVLEKCHEVLIKGGKFIIVNSCSPEAGDTDHRREKLRINDLRVLDKTCSYKWYSSRLKTRLIFPRINGPIMTLRKTGRFRIESEWLCLINRLCSNCCFYIKYLRLVMTLHCLSCLNVPTKNTCMLNFTSVRLKNTLLRVCISWPILCMF